MAFSKSMAYYQEACHEHQEFGIYDQKFQETMMMVRDFHRAGVGTGSPCILPFDILMRASSYVTESIKESAEDILRYNQHGGGNILGMIRSYFQLCHTTADSLRELRKNLGVCVNQLRAIVLRKGPVMEAVRCVESAANRSFLSLTHLIGKHLDTLTALQEARGKDLSVGSATRSRQVITIILVTVFSSAVIFSILAAAFHFPPALAALPAAVISITSWAPFIKWLDGLWVKVEEGRRRRGEKKPSSSMQQLEEIKLLTDNITTVSLPDRLKVADDRKRSLLPGALLKDMAELDKHMEKCCSDILKAKHKVHKKTTEPRRRRDRARAFLHRQAHNLREEKEKFLVRLGIDKRA